MAGKSFTVDPAVLTATSAAMSAESKTLPLLGALPEVAGAAALGGNPSFLTGTACQAFAGQLRGVLTALSERILDHGLDIKESAESYVKTDTNVTAKIDTVRGELG